MSMTDKSYAVMYEITTKRERTHVTFQDVIKAETPEQAGAEMQGRYVDLVGEGPIRVTVQEISYLQPEAVTRGWDEYPQWTRARALGGGWWVKVASGWKWHSGSTFPQPGADAVSVQIPVEVTT
jgi:hypothetical protein